MQLRFLCAVLLLVSFIARADPSSLRTADHPQRVAIHTSVGVLIVRLDWAKAPKSCAAFVGYIRDGVYSATSFDDIDEAAIFGGKPSIKIPDVAGNGNMACDKGPPGEFALPNVVGAVGFRRTVGSCNPAKRSNCTQIYVRFVAEPASDGQFTVFAAIEGTDTLEAIRTKLLKKQPVPFTVELLRE